MSFKMNKRLKNKSIVFRVTLWYSIFLLIFIVALLGLTFLLSTNLADSAIKKEMVESATEISQDPSEYEAVDDGIYYSIYDSSGKVVRSSFPNGFDQSLPFNQAGLQTLKIGQRTYLYFDMELTNQGQWLRAVALSRHSEHEWSNFLLIMVFISPLLLVIIIAGGYFILKRAFIPVEQLSRTALEIKQSEDLSKRLHLANKNDELHRLGQTFNLMLDSLEESFEREQQFNKDVSHELRTPVAVILSESEYGIKYAENAAERQEAFQTINRQAKRMKAIIEQILELSHLENQSELKKETLSLSDLVADKAQDFQKLAEAQHVELKTSIASNCQIAGDSLLLHRLLDNLLSNALKFTRDAIEISLLKMDKSCQLSIKDNGLGLAPSELNKIWNRFYQVDQARSKKKLEGSGLGLALVRQIVDLHQAQIRVESSPNQGSSFIVNFRLLD